ncbi:hypothetical protein RFI_20132, partial [Reticulomyxa filosa]
MYFGMRYLNDPTDIVSKSVRNKPKYKHLQYVVNKLNENKEVTKYIGQLKSVKVSKLTPADRSNYRTRYVTELWAECTGGQPATDITGLHFATNEEDESPSETAELDSNLSKSKRKKPKKEETAIVRILLCYGEERSLAELKHIEMQLDDDILKLEILEKDLSALSLFIHTY